MQTIQMIIEYDGTDYCGWQIQPNGISIQEKLTAALTALTGEKITVHGSGRTDAGVHARGQCASFKTKSRIPANRFAPALNTHLPPDICVLETREASPDFHARYSALGKAYSYHFYVHPQGSALLRNVTWQLRQWPDTAKMEAALEMVTGTHDFAAFRAANSDVKDTVRTIWKASLHYNEPHLRITYQGNGFLYKMVRMLSAAVVQVGLGKMPLEAIRERLNHPEANYRKLTAPPQGLFLDRVYYEAGELPLF
ncbi:tRNA pseudouridine(38-40) synthase TruA [Anoxynatronum sibiricum]|uniref:tRNA pseudouridine synthase A n=1 Tax=Anoxynatronum sibiricum TaxID=210623 RepID=A0ABU9VZ38_9CLOT